MRKQPTPEQKARAAERRAKLREIAQKISKLPEADRAALVDHWPVTIEGHRLSLHNACMIALQGSATVVGGFQQWKKAGRSVRKGQHGFGIWVPIGLPKKTEANPEPNGANDPQGFTVGTVFDISQTDPQTSEVAA